MGRLAWRARSLCFSIRSSKTLCEKNLPVVGCTKSLNVSHAICTRENPTAGGPIEEILLIREAVPVFCDIHAIELDHLVWISCQEQQGFLLVVWLNLCYPYVQAPIVAGKAQRTMRDTNNLQEIRVAFHEACPFEELGAFWGFISNREFDVNLYMCIW